MNINTGGRSHRVSQEPPAHPIPSPQDIAKNGIVEGLKSNNKQGWTFANFKSNGDSTDAEKSKLTTKFLSKLSFELSNAIINKTEELQPGNHFIIDFGKEHYELSDPFGEQKVTKLIVRYLEDEENEGGKWAIDFFNMPTDHINPHATLAGVSLEGLLALGQSQRTDESRGGTLSSLDPMAFKKDLLKVKSLDEFLKEISKHTTSSHGFSEAHITAKHERLSDIKTAILSDRVTHRLVKKYWREALCADGKLAITDSEVSGGGG